MVKTNVNEVLRDPWKTRGRWYHLFYENSSSSITECDSALKDISTVAEHVLTVTGVAFVPCDVKVIPDNRTAGSTGQFSWQILEGNLNVTIPSECDVDIYIFGYFD